MNDAIGPEQRDEKLAAAEVRIDVELTVAKAELAKVAAERDEYRKLVLHLREEVERLRRGLLGQKAERLPRNDAQLSLAILEMAFGSQGNELPAADKQLIGPHERRRPARKPLPAELPRVTIEIQPPEVEREGRDAFECIGSERREVLERRPASSVVVELVYPKYVRKDRERHAAAQVLMAESVELPITRGIAGPCMLADTVVRRFADHQPLHRMEGSYSRENLELARSTMCTWHEELAELACPVVDAMFADALTQAYLCVDATGVLVQAPRSATTDTSGCWSLPSGTCSTAIRGGTTARLSTSFFLATADTWSPTGTWSTTICTAPVTWWKSDAGRMLAGTSTRRWLPTPNAPKWR